MNFFYENLRSGYNWFGEQKRVIVEIVENFSSWSRFLLLVQCTRYLYFKINILGNKAHFRKLLFHNFELFLHDVLICSYTEFTDSADS